MGKRKERRLAALSNAGRRLKLDLFVEPSGDLGASSVHGEVGGDIDPTQHAGLPNSPSSSGQQAQNPLLLLGQYSDDELDEESNKMPNHTVTENSPTHLNDEEPCSEEKDMDANTVGEGGDQKIVLQVGKRVSTPVDALQSLENFDSKGVDTAASADVCNSAELVSVPEAFDAQLPGDISMGWRMVMHEESSQYYYWNIETGETSWELPDVLVQATQSTSNQKALVTENTETASIGADELSSNSGDLDNHPAAFTTDNSVSANLIPRSEDTHGEVPQEDGLAEGCRHEPLQEENWVTDADQSELKTNTTAVNVSSDDGNLVVDLHDSVVDDENKRAITLSTSLMKQCESLLERLKSLKGYENQIQDGRLLKYVLEVEIRLSDIMSLSTYGSLLLPFWTHSEKQLKQLEDAINNEIYQLAVSAQLDDIVEANGDSCFKDKEKPRQTVRLESEAHGFESSRKFESSSEAHGTPDEAAQQSFVCANHISSIRSPNRHLPDGAAVNEEVNGTAHLKPEFQDGEDVDMDVDMEIEDGVTTTALDDALITKEPNPSAEFQSLASANALTVPPPPEEEWIPPPPPDNDMVPPPPPDNEQLPPPPPDEPSESSYSSLPPYADIGQPPLYTEQYNSLYPDSEFPYYGHQVNLPGSDLYGHAAGSQVAMPNVSIYYEATVPNTYTETAAVIVGPAESLAYYNLQDGSVPPVPVVSGLESSHLFTESGPVIYKTLSSDRVITVADSLESRPTVKHDVAVVGGGTDLASAVVASALTSTQAPTSNVKEDNSVPSTDSVTAIDATPAPSTTAKGQSKVVRGKKRTVAVAPTLRSNKKVNSLVDKWKAVKEELNENAEDEPENPYEILEKKRQREIEEWHAKQIASGEARDNANFQPLGGDWRERVKRRRAQAVKEAAQTPVEVGPTDESQQPDLAEVSKGLPSGWQPYWDEGSKQVYYGNAITSETTWTRPAK